MKPRLFIALCCVALPLVFANCSAKRSALTGDAPPPILIQYPSTGSVERLAPQLDALIPSGAVIELLASGFNWSEGPVWLPREKALLFSDVPKNVVLRWSEGMEPSIYLQNSGYTRDAPSEGGAGSNGLTLDSQARLVLAQHGDRQIARLEKEGATTPLAKHYNGRRFNSPNDLVFKSNGDLYFTDPPYGLSNLSERELDMNGVFRLGADGNITLLVADLTRPNGLGFSPDESILYVAVSDPASPVIMAYSVTKAGTLENGRVFFDASGLLKTRQGLPDGLKVDRHGNLFATGPGGVLVIAPDGRHLGSILPGSLTANCAWGDDGSTLYMTAHKNLCRIRTSTRGAVF